MFNCERQKVLLIRSKMRMLRQIQLKFLSTSADTLRKQKKRVRDRSYYLGTLYEQEWSSIR